MYRDTKQGYVLSYILFNLYTEAVFEKALLGESAGIIINAEVTNNS